MVPLSIIALLLTITTANAISTTANAISTTCNLTIASKQNLHDIPSLIEQHPFHNNTDDFHICFHPSETYQLSGKPLRLNGTLHNHPNGGRIVWRPTTTPTTSTGAPLTSTTPPILSAGAPLQHWYRCNDGVHCPGLEWNDVFVHLVSDIANLTAPFLPVRQLWVNGTRAARSSMDGSTLNWKVSATGYTAPAPVPTDYITSQVELLWPRTIKNWIQPRCTVTALNGSDIIVNPTCWKNLIARHGGKLPPVPTSVENILRPPAEGEFVATPLYIFFKPFAASPYAAPTNAFVPIQKQIMTATGLQNHTFTGLQFSHATWRIPTSPSGYVPGQTLVTSSGGEPVGAVQLSHSRNVRIQKCAFINIGAAYGLSVGLASQNIVVAANTFVDLSGGALKIGNVLNTTRALTTDIDLQDRNYDINNNVMDSIAVEYAGGACIFAGYVANATIRHNAISNTGYTGISLGWGWGTHVTGPQTYAADNHIVGNRLISVMSNLNDGGCTYTLGPQPRSTVSDNYCSIDSAPVVGCFYHDNGSRYFTTKNNVCNASPAPCVYLQGCCNAPAYDIAVSNLWCRATAPVRNGCAAENCTIDNATVYMLKSGTKWPSAAQSIVDASGVASVGSSVGGNIAP